MIDLAKRYAAAVATWVGAGRPVRPAHEVERIFLEHCQPCEHRDGGRCSLCGCRIARDGHPLANKIAMATSSCPDDPPRWEANVPEGKRLRWKTANGPSCCL